MFVVLMFPMLFFFFPLGHFLLICIWKNDTSCSQQLLFLKVLNALKRAEVVEMLSS